MFKVKTLFVFNVLARRPNTSKVSINMSESEY